MLFIQSFLHKEGRADDPVVATIPGTSGKGPE